MNTRTGTAVQTYEYDIGSTEIPALWSGLAPFEPEGANDVAQAPKENQQIAALLAQQAQEMEAAAQLRIEAGRSRGFEEGRTAERQAQAASQAGERDRRQKELGDLLAQFEVERDRYLREAEPEVVALALAVAARILRRESQMDPLLLTGAVRVALGQLAKTTNVRLHVPPSDFNLWNEAIAHVPNLMSRPTVVVGEGMRTGDCRLETELGSVDLGIRAQLGEIERGFFDRAGASIAGIGDVLPEAQQNSEQGDR